jgi:hypothetical protein
LHGGKFDVVFANVFEPLHNFQQVLPIDLEGTAA